MTGRNPAIAIALLPSLWACGGEGAGRRRCPRIELPEVVQVDGAYFGEASNFSVDMVHGCNRGGTIQIDGLASSDLDRFSFTAPPPLQVTEGDTRTLRMAFTPTGPSYRYEGKLTVQYGETTVQTTLIGLAAPDQDGDGVDAEAVGGTDCNDLDPRVQVASPEVEDGLDNDCDGMVDEDFVEAGALRIAEAMTQPRGARAEYGQYVEVLNVSDRAVLLRGYRVVHDEGSLRVVDDAEVQPGQRVLLGIEKDTGINGGIDVQALMVGDLLPDEPKELALVGDVTHSEAILAAWPGNYGVSAELDERMIRTAAETKTEAWCGSVGSMGGASRGTPSGANRECPALDFDGDGFSKEDGDCDDNRAETYPAAPEAWNDLDDNCDGLIDTMWIEDRLDDELLGLMPLDQLALGPNPEGGPDDLVIVRNDVLYRVDTGLLWGGRSPSEVALSTVTLDEATDGLMGQTGGFGRAKASVLLSRSPGTAGAPIQLLSLPNAGAATEADVVTLTVMPDPAVASPTSWFAQDTNGDGAEEIVFSRGDRALLVDVSTGTGTVSETDATLTAIQADAPLTIERISAVAWDDDGYPDLAVVFDDRVELQTGIIKGRATLPDEMRLVAEMEVVIPEADPIWVGDGLSDGAREMVVVLPGAIDVFHDIPTRGTISGREDARLLFPPQHTAAALVPTDVDGDEPNELVVVSNSGTAGRAWFIDDAALTTTDASYLVDVTASQWAPIRTAWLPLGGLDGDGDGRDQLLFLASGAEHWLQLVPARP